MVKAFLTLAACMGAVACSVHAGGDVRIDETAIRARAAVRAAEILSAPDMDVPAGAPQFFVSPDGSDDADGRSEATAWRTLARLATEKVPSGSFVRFRRGGTWRGMVRARPGVTYAAYGKGAKPCLVGSPENGADAAKWKPSGAPYVWVYPIGKADVGTLVFDGGSAHAAKVLIRTNAKTGETTDLATGRPFRGFADLDGDLRFWHDYRGTGNLYLFSAENPGRRFRFIEFNVKHNGFDVGNTPGVTIDNFTVRNCGNHGVGAGNCTNLTVSNCSFEWIGGSIQGERLFGRDHPTRLGNGVEIYGCCSGYTVSNCLFRQIYDAGATHQLTIRPERGAARLDQRDVLYTDNVFENCNYSIEYWLGAPTGNMSRMDNVRIVRNIMLDAGFGFCEQRPDRGVSAHIKGGYGPNRNRAKGFVICGNVMCRSMDRIVDIGAGLPNEDGTSSLPVLEGNVVVGPSGAIFGTIADRPGAPRLPLGPEAERAMNEHGHGNECRVVSPSCEPLL